MNPWRTLAIARASEPRDSLTGVGWMPSFPMGFSFCLVGVQGNLPRVSICSIELRLVLSGSLGHVSQGPGLSVACGLAAPFIEPWLVWSGARGNMPEEPAC